MNTSHVDESVMPRNDSPTYAMPKKLSTSDPFGIKAAAVDAMSRKSKMVVTIAKLANSFLMFVGLTPFLLLAIFPVLIANGAGPVVNYLAIVYVVWLFAFVAHQLRLFEKKPNLMQPMDKGDGKSDRVVVIGAGPVGLAVVKECLEQGLDVMCFEGKSGLGGVYRFDEMQPSGVWKSARLTSSPWVTAFSDFPPSSPSSIHHSHQEYVNYLEDYAEHFSLKQKIYFGKQVESVESLGKMWRISVKDLQTSNIETIECERVAVCSGVHQTPKEIMLPGIDGYKGEIRHVAGYKGPGDLEGKVVVVAGLGESGADITHELSKVAKKVILSIQRGKFVIPRINPITGKANDYDTNRIRNSAPIYVKNGFMSLKRRLCGYMGHHSPESAIRAKLLQVSQAGANTQTATKSDDFIKSLLEDKLEVAREIMCFDNNHVVFADGHKEIADVVIFAHGYFPHFPFLKISERDYTRHPSEMYLNMFDPEIGSSLAFCGFARPALGAIPPVGELQARLFALVSAGKLILPAKEDMRGQITQDQRENRERFPTLPEKNVVVSWIAYMDKIAMLIGCRPDPWKLLRSPTLLWRVLTGAVNGAHYRLHGVGAKPIAVQTVNFLRGEHEISEILTMLGLHFWVWPFALMQKNKRYQSDISSL